MRQIISRLWLVPVLISILSCQAHKNEDNLPETKIVFLHHSVGEIIWNGTTPSFLTKALSRLSPKLAGILKKEARIPNLFSQYNAENGTSYSINELTFPKEKPYGWNNFPYDYYNIWVANAGPDKFMDEPTLEILTSDFQVIIFKHCFPVGYIDPDRDSSDIDSDKKTLSNYKLQYLALKDKLHEYSDTKFILFTGAALTRANVSPERALRTREFFEWVINEWDQPDDNIFLWDLYNLQTEGDIYLKDIFAQAPDNSHPNALFATKATPLFFQRIIDVIETNGYNTSLTGEAR